MTRKILDLNGSDWQLGQAPSGGSPNRASWQERLQVTEWLPATVPGNVRADLVRAGRLPDLTYGTQAAAAQWVDQHSWWLERSLDFQRAPGQRVHLMLRGVDYVGDVFFNGHHLGRHEGMFSSQVHEITALLQEENRLAVRVLGSRWLPSGRSSLPVRLLNYAESKVGSIGSRFPQRRDTLKCQMGFGWDFAPALRTMGIWDDVCAIISGDILIREVQVETQWVGDTANLQIEVTLDALSEGEPEICCMLAGDTFQADPLRVAELIQVQPGISRHRLSLPVPSPRLWWPWDHGSPELYRLDLEVRLGDRRLDRETRLLGLRRVEWDGWTLQVNGKRVYARGANWVPAGILPGCAADDDYRVLLSLAVEANMNLLRVWGGGLREKQAFYRLCDRMGIMVWQEFPLACAFLTHFPSSADYLGLVERETRAIVTQLRLHPSLVLWCGGNEFDPGRNRPVVEVMKRVVSEEDPARTFRPASPSDGDSHNWDVWHSFQPPSAYARDPALFASEFGLQSPPNVAALERFIPAEELWPPGPSWKFHGAELDKLRRYAQPYLSVRSPSLQQFVEACQLAQARGLQFGIEHYRRGKSHGGGGVLVWQLNEPWPAISWALVGFCGEPKLAYKQVQRSLAPLLISLEYPSVPYQAGDTLRGKVWVVNDLHQTFWDCQMEVALQDVEGETVASLRERVNVQADATQVIGDLAWRLPPGGTWRITCHLKQAGRVLTANDYDLGHHDGVSPTARQRLRAWLGGLVVPSLRDQR